MSPLPLEELDWDDYAALRMAAATQQREQQPSEREPQPATPTEQEEPR